ncbi:MULTISPECIES: DUF4406 domain-containing protein [Mesorhizobium]|uniref:DUF4406 domain-containing protein n=1 Tax=Mesorhizobium TaxID=68287 RepID=UPI0018F19EE4
MRGIPLFNYPAFHAAAAKLRAEGHEVFSPAERDTVREGKDISIGNAAGCEILAAAEHGFSTRIALADDCDWICRHAEAIALLPGWQNSRGAKAELALAEAIGLEVVHL